MDTQLLTWIAMYITLITILFNVLRYCIKINLLTSAILSISVSFLMTRIHVNEFVGDWGGWLANYTWAIILLAGLVTIIFVTARPTKKTCEPDQRKNWTVIFRIRK